MRVWSERDGRADVVVHGYSFKDNLLVIAAGFIVLAAAAWVVGGLA